NAKTVRGRFRLVALNANWITKLRRGGSPAEFHAEIQAVRPEVRLAEGIRWAEQPCRLDAGRRVGHEGDVDDAVDLFAGPDDIAPVEALVTREEPHVWGDLVADVQVQFRHHGERIAARPPDVGLRGQQAADEDRRAGARRHDNLIPPNID